MRTSWTRPHRARTVVVVLALAVLATGCRLDGLQFRTDDRVTWQLEDRSVVSLPLTLRWELEDFEMVGADGSAREDAGYVAIFLDRHPQPPSAPLTDLAEDDDSCLAIHGCPDTDWFTQRGVYPVEEGQTLVLDRLPAPEDPDRRDRRDFTLVLLDGRGHRIGESAFTLTLEIDRAAAEGS